MREILFRGKPLGYLDNSFIYGSLGVISIDLVAIYQCKEFVEDEIILVDIGTVGQYTGLTDKNGKKIFEGDILKYKNFICKYNIGYVMYGKGCFSVKDIHSDSRPAIDIVLHESKKDLEVIGNIHDNPELLKGGEADA